MIAWEEIQKGLAESDRSLTFWDDPHPDAKMRWKQFGLAIVFVLLAVTIFHVSYVGHCFSLMVLFGYCLLGIAEVRSARLAFYLGLLVGFGCYAPHLWFFYGIFNAAAIVLWLILAFYVGLFVLLTHGTRKQFGRTAAVLLAGVYWMGCEYFRSEMYFLKFSWLTVGLADPGAGGGVLLHHWGVYGLGFLSMLAAGGLYLLPWKFKKVCLLLYWSGLQLLMLVGQWLPRSREDDDQPAVEVAALQVECPMPSDVPRLLNKALKEHPLAELFVMSEYTFDGPVPESTFQWCRTHQKYLIVGGKDMLGGGKFYNTAFVISPEGKVVFKQVKSVPIQFFKDGLPAPELKLWNSPWGKVGICICYDFGYTHVVDRLVRMGAQMLVVPTMDAEEWGAYEHKLHLRVVSARAQEHGLPVVRLASSGISQIYSGGQHPRLMTQTTFPGPEETMGCRLSIPEKGTMPWDRILARICVGLTGIMAAILSFRSRGQLKFRVA